jgi:hypothetical protein
MTKAFRGFGKLKLKKSRTQIKIEELEAELAQLEI